MSSVYGTVYIYPPADQAENTDSHRLNTVVLLRGETYKNMTGDVSRKAGRVLGHGLFGDEKRTPCRRSDSKKTAASRGHVVKSNPAASGVVY